MRNKLQNSAASSKGEISYSSKASSTSNIKKKCFGSFFNCFKLTHKKESRKCFVNYEHQDCDYIVEKLIVKRVPLILFTTSESSSQNTSNDFKKDMLKLPQEVKTNIVHPNISETQSLLYYSDSINGNRMSMEIPNKCLYFNANMTVLSNENKANMLSNDYAAKIKEIMNTMSSLHPDLKECERPPKDPYPLNTPKNKINEIQLQQTFMIPVTSVSESYLSKKEMECIRFPKIKLENKPKIYNLRQEQSMCLGKNNSKSKEAFSIQPIQNLFCNLADFRKTVIDINQLNVEDYNPEQDKIKSKIIGKELHDQSQDKKMFTKTLSENIININPSTIRLRWKITVKNYKSKI